MAGCACGAVGRVCLWDAASPPPHTHTATDCKFMSPPTRGFHAPLLVELDLSRTAVSDFELTAFMGALVPGRLHTLRLQGCKNLKHSFCGVATTAGAAPTTAQAAVSGLRTCTATSTHMHPATHARAAPRGLLGAIVRPGVRSFGWCARARVCPRCR
jgi:hypothetical protein